MSKKIVAIGDLHGHYNEMMQVLDRLRAEGIDFKKDTLVFLGDYVDGGPDTKGVLDELIILKEMFPHFKFLFGNHESLLLDAFSKEKPIYGSWELWHRQGGKETLNSFKPPVSFGLSEYERAIMQPKDLITQEYMDFLYNLDLFYETDEYFFVHAGLYPNRSIQEHLAMVSEQYPSGFHPAFMKEGDMAYDMIWIREPFIDADYDWGKKIIFGHTTWPYYDYRGIDPDNNEEVHRPGYPFVRKNQIGIDTMRHNEGRITALILPEEKFVFSDFSSEE